MPSAASSAKTAPRRADAAPRVAGEIAPLRVGGFVPFSASDFPGALAAVVFCQGCPWRCRYCHNPHLIPAAGETTQGFDAILARLAQRQGLLDAVVFSGGEPLAQAGLGDAMREVRALRFAIGLHTGGAYPRRLDTVLPLVDWLGLDVKAPGDDYARVTGVAGSGAPAWASLDLAIASGVDVEVRTTVHASLTSSDALERMAHDLAARGVQRWVLQRFRAQGCDDSALLAAPPTLDDALVARLARHVPEVAVRG